MAGKAGDWRIKRRRVRVNFRRLALLVAICSGLTWCNSQVIWDDSWSLSPAPVQAHATGDETPAYEQDYQDYQDYLVVQVQAGDNLWRLAQQYGADYHDVRKVVDQIRRLNGLEGAAVWPGQLLAIPVR